MAVHYIIPFSLEKKLGKAYNESMKLVPEDDWACFMDGDMMFLVPDYGTIIHEYVKRNPEAGILTCFTNRLSTLSHEQLLHGGVDETADIRMHIKYAERQKKLLYQVTPIERDISGFLMVISKKVWNEFKFAEHLQCLGVDTEYNRRIRAAGKKIMRMDGMYCWHSYRLLGGIFDKKHLL